MNTREKGSRYEETAADFLIRQGYTVLERNYRRKTGEIDLIASDAGMLVFVEVKYRTSTEKGYPAEAVDYRKQQRIRRTAEWYLKEHGHAFSIPCRFDVISILDRDEIRHLKNAFGGF